MACAAWPSWQCCSPMSRPPASFRPPLVADGSGLTCSSRSRDSSLPEYCWTRASAQTISSRFMRAACCASSRCYFGFLTFALLVFPYVVSPDFMPAPSHRWTYLCCVANWLPQAQWHVLAHFWSLVWRSILLHLAVNRLAAGAAPAAALDRGPGTDHGLRPLVVALDP